MKSSECDRNTAPRREHASSRSPVSSGGSDLIASGPEVVARCPNAPTFVSQATKCRRNKRSIILPPSQGRVLAAQAVDRPETIEQKGDSFQRRSRAHRIGRSAHNIWLQAQAIPCHRQVDRI